MLQPGKRLKKRRAPQAAKIAEKRGKAAHRFDTLRWRCESASCPMVARNMAKFAPVAAVGETRYAIEVLVLRESPPSHIEQALKVPCKLSRSIWETQKCRSGPEEGSHPLGCHTRDSGRDDSMVSRIDAACEARQACHSPTLFSWEVSRPAEAMLASDAMIGQLNKDLRGLLSPSKTKCSLAAGASTEEYSHSSGVAPAEPEKCSDAFLTARMCLQAMLCSKEEDTGGTGHVRTPCTRHKWRA